jgi:hypothetical protein
LDATDHAGFFVNPVNSGADITYTLQYDITTKEIYYNPPVSDLRLKTNVSDTTLGIDFINRLRPVEFQWRDRSVISLTPPADGSHAVKSPGVRTHQGLIAQEVKTVLDDLSIDSAIYVCISHSQSTNNMNGIQGVRYEELITPTIKAVQDVYAIVKQQSEQIAELKALIQTLTT